jgi:hypothetical protein
MHAAVLADQPLEIAGLGVLVFGVTHQRPSIRCQIVRVVVDTHVDADLFGQIIPLKARHLACLAADAFGHVDQLGNFRLPGRGRRDVGSRTLDQVLFAKLRVKRLGLRVRNYRKHCSSFPLSYRPGDGLDVDKERLEFRRL